MEKQHTSKQENRLGKAFWATVCQYVIFGMVFVVALKWLSHFAEQSAAMGWFIALGIYILPVLSGCVYRLWRNKGKLCFCIDNIKDKVFTSRLALRLACVCAFVLLGIVFVTNHELQMPVKRFLYQFGEIGYGISETLSNTNLLLAIGLFPVSDAIVEYLFAENKEHRTES